MKANRKPASGCTRTRFRAKHTTPTRPSRARAFTTTTSNNPPTPATTRPTPKTVSFTIVGPNDYKKDLTVPVGRNLRQVLQAARVEMLPSVCNGQLQCSTCHIKLPPRIFDSSPHPELGEQDILDICADFDLNSSRLACQLQITPQFDQQTLVIPDHFVNHMDDPTCTVLPTSLLDQRAV